VAVHREAVSEKVQALRASAAGMPAAIARYDTGTTRGRHIASDEGIGR
jgi:hypothetical protein